MTHGNGLPLGLPPDTYSVSRLCGEVRDLLGEAYPRFWVAGEVARLRSSRRGHLYFELVEKGAGDEIVGKLEAVCWSRDFRRVRRLLAESGQTLAEGQEIRCRASLDFYPPFGRLQLVIRDVDPVFTLGRLARRRRQTLEHLAAAGLLERNRELELSPLPLRLALVTSQGSAAYHDFMSTLEESPWGFQVFLIHAAVQGRDAERELVAALEAVRQLEVDCAVLVRGGGARTDLAAFDSRSVAEGVALAPVPVLTGLGHEIDETIADRVAHTALKTPTKVAELLIERVRQTDAAVARLSTALAGQALESIHKARRALDAAERGLGLAGLRLRAARERLAAVAALVAGAGRSRVQRAGERLLEARRRLSSAARRSVSRVRREPERLGRRLAAAGRSRLRQAATGLEGRARLCRGLGVDRTLARGFTITRSPAGRILKSSAGLAAGDLLETEWLDGRRNSRVEET